MGSQNYELNTVTYNTLIDGYCKKGQLDGAKKCFDEMPDTVMYNTMIDGYCGKGKLEKVKKCSDEIVSQNCEPDTVTYNTLVCGYCKIGELYEAKKCLDEMLSRNCEPDTVTYNGELDEAKMFFDELVSQIVCQIQLCITH
ncbi:hypothetical protein LguiA_017909 [Lonicera macranthoides]